MTSLSPSTVKDFICNVAQTHNAGGLPTVAMMNTYDLKIRLKNVGTNLEVASLQ